MILHILFAAGGFILGALIFRNNPAVFNSLISGIQADIAEIKAAVKKV